MPLARKLISIRESEEEKEKLLNILEAKKLSLEKIPGSFPLIFGVFFFGAGGIFLLMKDSESIGMGLLCLLMAFVGIYAVIMRPNKISSLEADMQTIEQKIKELDFKIKNLISDGDESKNPNHSIATKADLSKIKPYLESGLTFIIIGGVIIILLIIWKANTSGSNTNTTDSTKTQNTNTIDSKPESPQTNKVVVDTTIPTKADRSKYDDIYTIYTVSSDKAYFYSAANEESRKKAYVEKGQQIQLISELNGFIYTEFTNQQGVKTVGWIKKDDITESTSEDQQYKLINNSSVDASDIIIDPSDVIQNANTGNLKVYRYMIDKDITSISEELKRLGAKFNEDGTADWVKIPCCRILFERIEDTKTRVTYYIACGD